MKQFSKVVAIVAALVMACAFTSCKNLTNEDDGNSTSKLNAPTNLVINVNIGEKFPLFIGQLFPLFPLKI